MAFQFLGIGSGPDTSKYSGNPDLARFGPNPASTALSESLSKMPGFTPISTGGSTYSGGDAFKENAYQAKDMSGAALPQFDAMRRRLDSQYSKTQSQAQDSLDRQFAAAGGGPGNGAQAKQTENLASSIAAQKGNDLEGIDAQEGAARQTLQLQENQNAFQSGEAQKGFGFQAGQADLGRRFAAGESAAGRQQSAEQFNAQMQQAENQFGFTAGTSLANMNLAWDQAQAESNNNEFNKALSEWQAKHSGGLLGGGGFLGLGIGEA